MRPPSYYPSETIQLEHPLLNGTLGHVEELDTGSVALDSTTNWWVKVELGLESRVRIKIGIRVRMEFKIGGLGWYPILPSCRTLYI